MHRTVVQYVSSGWRRAGQLLANFFPFGLSLERESQKSLRKLTRPNNFPGELT